MQINLVAQRVDGPIVESLSLALALFKRPVQLPRASMKFDLTN